MAASIVLMPVVGSREIEVLGSFEDMILDSIARVGGDIRVYETPCDLEGASHLVVPGVGYWGGDKLKAALVEAGRRGVRRVLWQMETLPPPDLPRSLAAKFLLRKTPYRVTRISRQLDNLALRRLLRECEKLSWWSPGGLAARRLGLPMREARHIRVLWRDGLLDRILVSLESRQQFLQSVGVESVFMPFGYHVSWGRPLECLEKDLDVVFIGTPTPRRAPLLKSLEVALSKAGYRLTVVEGGCYGEQRTELLNRSKILLQLRNYPWELPRPRMMMAMGCKTLFVTEQFADTRPFQPDEHFVMAPHESLAETIVAYLRNGGGRRTIIDTAYDFVTSELAMGRLLIEALRP